MLSILPRQPFAPSTTSVQAATYLLGVALFSISFLVFLNSGISFVVTDLLGRRDRVGDVVGTLGFADELVALVACPVWGLASDRLGVRWVAVLGYAILAVALALVVRAREIYPGLLAARILFAIGATAAATMVTAILPSMTDQVSLPIPTATRSARHSLALSCESDATITPDSYRPLADPDSTDPSKPADTYSGKPSVLAGYVGFFTGCGALIALVCFLPLPARFSAIEGVTPGQAVEYSFYVVACVAFAVAVAVFFGLRGIKGEEGKGWRVLLGLKPRGDEQMGGGRVTAPTTTSTPYFRLLRESIRLGIKDSDIALGYLGGFVARASSVAIALFIPLFVNTFYINNGFCHVSSNDPSPELKRECRSAYILAAILTGVAQLVALLSAPVFGYLSSGGRGWKKTTVIGSNVDGRQNHNTEMTQHAKWRGLSIVNIPVVVAAAAGIIAYSIFPTLRSPEFKDVENRGGSPAVFVVMALMGISQIGAIVCSLGSLGKGVLAADPPRKEEEYEAEDETTVRLLAEANAGDAAGWDGHAEAAAASRVRLKGSIAGVYSWCGGAAILILTKLGGHLFDTVSMGAPFYMMAVFNAILLVATVAIDLRPK